MASVRPEIAVVVPTFGRPDRLLALLDRLDRQTLDPARFEVIVVDDGTEPPLRIDPSGVDPAGSSYPIALLRQENAGPAAARNRALASVRAPLCLFLNDDSVPAEDLLAAHLAAHRELAAGGRREVAVLGTFRFTARALASPFVRLLDRTDLLFDFPGLADGREYGWTHFWTCNLSLPTELVRTSGGFDASFREAVVEDVELGWRLAQRGLAVVHRAEARCDHDHVLTPRGWLVRQARLGANLARMHAKHGDARILRQTDPAVRGERLLRPFQVAFELLHPRVGAALATLERFDAEQGTREIEPDLAGKLATLCARVGQGALARGVLAESLGRDPAEAHATGAARGELTSVIVPSHDALAATQACIAALRRCEEDGYPIEILCVDNGSSDGSREWLAAEAGVRLIANERNLGAPRARNQALAEARGAWIVFLDNDVVVTPGWLSRLRWHAEVDPLAACIGPVTGRAAHGQAVPLECDGPDAEARRIAAASPRGFRLATLLSSFCLLVRRDVALAIGGFDERFSPWGFEDDDYALRCALLGRHNRVALDVFVHHGTYGGARLARHDRLLDQNWERFRAKWSLPEDAPRGDYAALARHLERSWDRAELHLPLAGQALPEEIPVGMES